MSDNSELVDDHNQHLVWRTPFDHTDRDHLGRVKQIWYLWPMRTAKVQASLRIRAVSPEPPLLAHTGSESRGTFRQKARSLAPLNGWACAVKICHDGMLEDTNSLDGAQLITADSHQGPSYRKFPKYLDTQNICCNYPKSWTRWLFLRVMHPKDAEGIANSVDPDQTALFAQACPSENLGK